MRRLLTFSCEGSSLGAAVDDASGATGVLMVTGGTQTRAGSHRMLERLASGLAGQGYPCLRFDRRGVGDSEGDDPGFRGSGPDLRAAATALTSHCPSVRRIVGLGHCDGATALALFAREASLDGMILVNPWLVEAEADAPPPAAIKAHYRERLTSKEGWGKLLGGRMSYGKALRGILKMAAPAPSGLSSQVAAGLKDSDLPVATILARRDATAVAAEAEWTGSRFAAVRARQPSPLFIDSDSHTLARPGDDEALLTASLKALPGLEESFR